jgi:glycosyltransferase involved in cell wall biosynthesis
VTSRRIAIDAHVITGKFQGSRTYLTQLLQMLGEIDQRNTYVIFSYDRRVTERMFPFPNYEHRTIPVRNQVLRNGLYWSLAEARFKLDALMTQYIVPPLCSMRLATVIHDILPDTHPAFFPLSMRLRCQLLFRASAKRADLVFVPSNYTRQTIVARYGLDPRKVVLARNSAEVLPTLPATPAPANEHSPYILTVGRLEPRKNVQTLVRAFRQLGRDDLHLVVIGSEDFAFTEVLAQMRQTPRVVHLRDVSAEDLDRYYRGASAFVLPSYAEGFGLPLIEALARGVPVVASSQTALPEVGGRFAHYFDPCAENAIDQLVKALHEALREPPGWKPGLDEHLAAFSPRQTAAAVVAGLESLFAPRGSSRPGSVPVPGAN